MPASDTLRQHVLAARRRLERAGIAPEEASLDADVLARHALGGWERGRLLAAMGDACPPGFDAAFEPLLARRERREPSAYITGSREFWEIDIEVGPGVLVPRPETEELVEEALARLSDGPAVARLPGKGAPGVPPRVAIADIGTGSGCVAVALARWLPGATVTATDTSLDALAFARRNAERHGVADRVRLAAGDLLGGQPGPFDTTASNPPYVPSGECPDLQAEIRLYEPVSALDGGEDGLDVIRRLVPEAAAGLRPGGWLLFEFGYGQADGVRSVVEAEPAFEWHGTRADLAGIPRVAIARRRVAASVAPPPDPESRLASSAERPAGQLRRARPSPESRIPNPESRR